LTLQHNQLLTQKGIFGNKLGLAAREICKGTEHQMRFGRLEALFGGSFGCIDNPAERLADTCA
jgi:hypothetical protein